MLSSLERLDNIQQLCYIQAYAAWRDSVWKSLNGIILCCSFCWGYVPRARPGIVI